jgi:hypothetical protein
VDFKNAGNGHASLLIGPTTDFIWKLQELLEFMGQERKRNRPLIAKCGPHRRSTDYADYAVFFEAKMVAPSG